MTQEVKKIRTAVEVMKSFTDADWEVLDKTIAKLGIQTTTDDTKTESSEFKEVTKILKKLRVPFHIKGYEYLRTAVLMVIHSSDRISITKKMYPSLAEKFNDTPSRVERAIRHAISAAYDRASYESFESIFGMKYCPSNSEFIEGIADYLKVYIL